MTKTEAIQKMRRVYDQLMLLSVTGLSIETHNDLQSILDFLENLSDREVVN